MNLGDRLYELRHNILHDRSDMIVGDNDRLWSDETLLRYIKDADFRFARRTLMLRDGTTTAITRVRLRTGVKTYQLHASVLGVLSVRYHTDTIDLRRSGHALVNQHTPTEFLAFDPASTYDVSPGAPRAFYTDETLIFGGATGVTLTVYPEPSATEDGNYVYLRVVRLPQDLYTQEDLAQDCELPEDYQLDTLEWAAYRALRGYDSDTGAPTKAADHKAAFEEAVTRAGLEMKRKIQPAFGVQYGGNGFTWER